MVLKLEPAGRDVPGHRAQPELLMRWMELNAFTAVFRTHEGLDPAVSAQFDTNAETLAHMQRFAKVYKGLGVYRKGLVADAAHAAIRWSGTCSCTIPDDANTSACATSSCSAPT